MYSVKVNVVIGPEMLNHIPRASAGRPVGLPQEEARHLRKKHCQVEVQEKYLGHNFQTIRKFANNDFQYHREVIYGI